MHKCILLLLCLILCSCGVSPDNDLQRRAVEWVSENEENSDSVEYLVLDGPVNDFWGTAHIRAKYRVTDSSGETVVRDRCFMQMDGSLVYDESYVFPEPRQAAQ
jgi:hypothetical protein